jgi:lipopolysaccharide export system protein LptA
MNTRKAMAFGWGVVMMAATGLSAAEAGDVPAPGPRKTEITAGHLIFDYANMNAIFETNVVVQDSEMRLEAQKLWVLMDKVSQQITSAKATGKVKISEKDRVATGDQAEYNAKDGKLVLMGNATVTRGREMMKGDRITFWRGDNRIECVPATMVLFPEKGQSLGGMIQ